MGYLFVLLLPFDMLVVYRRTAPKQQAERILAVSFEEVAQVALVVGEED